MPLAEIYGSRIAVNLEYRDREAIKSVPGARFKNDLWTVPLSWAACVTLRGVFGSRLQVGEELQRWSWERWGDVDKALKLRTLLEGVDGDPLLYPFQRVDVAFLTTVRRALLANEMGTGKSVSTAVALRELGDEVYPVLLICPNTLKRNWEVELRRWLPDANSVVLGSKWHVKKRKWVGAGAAFRKEQLENLPERAVVICNYEMVRAHSRLAPYGSIELSQTERTPKELNAISFGAVVVDEAHRLVHPSTKWVRAIWSAAGGAPVRFALTGTPITSTPDDLWAILHFLDPEAWPTRSAYIDRWCAMSWNPFGGLQVIGVRADTREEFFKAVDPYFRRVTKDLVLPFLPPKIHERRDAEMSPKQAKAYEEMEREQLTVLEDGSRMLALNSLTKNVRLGQFASSYATVEADEVLLQEPSNKIDALVDLLDDLEPRESLVVAADSRKLIELAAKRLDTLDEKSRHDPWKFSYNLLVGGMTDVARQQAIEDFQAGRVRITMMTLKTGGVGVTLTKAKTMCFLQRSWSMIDNVQGEDRVHRIGSEEHDKVVIVDLVAPGTVEEDQVEAVLEKLRRLGEITRDEQALRERIDYLEQFGHADQLDLERDRLQALLAERERLMNGQVEIGVR